MINAIEQTHFNITIIREGLSALASPSDKQLTLNKQGLEYLDDIFDPMPLDYLPWLEKQKIITPNFTSKFKNLYLTIEQSIGHLDRQEEDKFISQNSLELQQWREIAKMLVEDIKNV